MTEASIRRLIEAAFREKPALRDIGLDDDFFDAGVSSLTIVELQLAIEEKLKMELATSTLVRFSTMKGWMDAYVNECAKRGQPDSQTIS